MSKPIYMDYAATTPVDGRVVTEMVKHLGMEGVFGNPASRSHCYGWQAEAAVEEARAQLATALRCDPRELVFTSGATEADNLALKGVMSHFASKGRHLVTSAYEHKAVLDSARWLESQGCTVSYVAPDAQGQVSVQAILGALRPDTVLVSLMHVNNEIGVVNDIATLGLELRARGILLHVDAAQSFGKVPVDLSALNVDLLSLSAHKFYGPKGIGALYVRRDAAVRLDAQMHGGGHERGMRSGTLPTHQIVGMGKAAELVMLEHAAESEHIRRLRDRLIEGALSLPGVTLNGHPQARVPGIINLSFEGVDGESLMLALRDLAISSGSACASASLSPSYVLTSMGLSDAQAHRSLRFSLGRFSVDSDVDAALSALAEALPALRRTHVPR